MIKMLEGSNKKTLFKQDFSPLISFSVGFLWSNGHLLKKSPSSSLISPVAMQML